MSPATRDTGFDRQRPPAAGDGDGFAMTEATAVPCDARAAAIPEGAARLLRVMGNVQRWRILCQLAAGELSVGELNARIRLTQSALSQHLAVLRTRGLVEARRDSRTVRYSLREGPAREILDVLDPHLRRRA